RGGQRRAPGHARLHVRDRRPVEAGVCGRDRLSVLRVARVCAPAMATGRRGQHGEMALVTGSATRVDDVSTALEETGYKVLRVPEPGDVAAACSGIEPGSLACYVQLPKETKVDAPSL